MIFLENIDPRVMRLIIKCHNPNNSYPGPHFFLLSKGRNTGKPLTALCANCFVVLTNTWERQQQLLWLCSSLWQAGIFRQHVSGSVIEFIRVREAGHNYPT